MSTFWSKLIICPRHDQSIAFLLTFPCHALECGVCQYDPDYYIWRCFLLAGNASVLVLNSVPYLNHSPASSNELHTDFREIKKNEKIKNNNGQVTLLVYHSFIKCRPSIISLIHLYDVCDCFPLLPLADCGLCYNQSREKHVNHPTV